MSKTVDERVVEMRFENDQFEQGIRQSTQSLEMLRQALRFDDATNSLANIENAVNNADFSGMAQSLDTISSRFTTLGIVGDQIIRKLTDGVTGLVAKVGSMIKQGGLTRATNIERAKFQLSGLGVAWDQVADSINYAVKGTRYGLDEAAVAASQLVASGVTLGDEMSTSLRSISGVAAMTNREYSDIAQIFTTVASNGKLMTMQLRQLSYSGLNASAALAKELGKTEEQINEMVSKGEIDFKTFATAMDNAFGEHATRANETFEGAFANMKAALARIGAEFWTPLMDGARDVINTITPIIDAIKGGLMPAFELFGEGVSTVSKNISETLGGINLEGITQGFKTMSEYMRSMVTGDILNADNLSTVGRILAGVTAIFSIFGKIVTAVGTALGQIFVALAPLGNAFLNVAAIIGDFLVWLNQCLESSQALQNIFSGLGAVIGGVVKVIGGALEGFTDVLAAIGQLDTSPVKKFGDNMTEGFHPAQTILHAFKVALEAVGNVLKSLAPAFQKVGDVLSQVFGKMGEAIANGGFVKALDAINSGLITYAIANFMDLGKAGDYLSKMIKRDIAPVSSYFKTLRSTLVSYQTSIQAGTLLKIASAVALLAASMVALSMVDPKRLEGGMAAMSGIFIELGIAMKVIVGFMSGAKFMAVVKANMLMQSLAVSIAILAGAMVALGQLDLKQIATALVGLSGAMIILVKGCSALAKVEGKLGPTSVSMIALAAAISIMANALVVLGSLDMASIGKGLLGLGGIMLELNLFLSKGNMAPMAMKSAATLVIFGAVLNVMAAALARIGSNDVPTIIKGLAGMAGILAEIAIFSQVAGAGGNLAAVGAGMILVGAGMHILAAAIQTLGGMDMASLGKGLLGLAGSLTAVGLATRLMPANLPAIGIGLIAVGAAMRLLSTSLASLGSMSWSELAVGLAALAGSMVILGVAMNAMTNAVPGALALTVMAAGLALLVPQLMALSTLSLPALGIALLALAGAMAAFGIAAAVLTPVVPIMLALGAAFTLLGIGVAGLGVGLLAVSAGLASLAGLGVAAASGLILVIEQLASAIPTVLANIGQGIVELAVAIGEGAPQVAAALGNLLIELLKVLTDVLPKIVEAGVELVVSLAESLVQNAPRLVQAAMSLIIALLEGIRNNIHKITMTATEIVTGFMGALSEGIPKIVEAGIQMVIDLVNGIANAIDSHAEELGVAAANLGIAIVNGVVKGLAGFATTIGNKLMEGARAAMAKVKSFLGISSPSKKFRDEVGKQIVAGVAIGATDKRGTIGKALVNSAETGLHTLKKALKINSPSVVFQEEVGRWIAEGITEGIEADDTVEEALKKKADNIVSAFQTALDRSSLLEDIARLNFEVWQQLWPDASDTHYYIEYKRYLNEVAKQAERRFKLAEDELEQTIKVVGRGTDEALEATRKMLEARKTYLEARQAVVDADIEIANKDVVAAQQMRDEAEELTDAQITLAQSQYELWQAMNPDASELEAAKRNIMYFNEQLELQEQKIEFLKEKLQETIAEFGSASKEVVEAQNAYLQAQKKYYDLINNRKNVVTSYKENAGLNDDDKKALEDAKNVIREQESNLADYERILRDLAETNERYSFGWSVDEMDAIARKQSGYNREAYENAKKTQQRIEEAMEKGVSELEKLLNGDYTALVKQFKELGWQYADALGKGFEDTMSDRVIPMMNNALNSVKQNLSNATEVDRTHNNSSSSILVGTGGIKGIKNPSSGSSSVSSGGGSANKIDTSVWKPSNIKPANPNVTVVANTNFNQTNNSPKTLSNSSIYRSTSSMFAGITGKVTSAVSSASKKVVNA